jgi:xenotropic and polytropic retrovirus receptor 1
MQCLRRYYDTRNFFPHLVNCGKYGMTIMTYVTLSMYRIEGAHSNLALFITFSTINGVYCSIWDLFMDFSLLQPNSRHYLLRDVLALKRRWTYYLIMIIDPILRFAWIFYAIFTYDAQHSTIVSFMVAFAEVTRRGMWTLFRVENEHCANVAQYKASRDVPLPYRIEPLVERLSLDEPRLSPSTTDTSGRSTGAHAQGGTVPRRTPQTPAAGVDPETVPDEIAPQAVSTATAGEQEAGTLRRRRTETQSGARSIRGIMALAHKQDYEKKRRPDGASHASLEEAGHSDDDEEEDEDEDEMGDRGSLMTRRDKDRDREGDRELREAEELVRRGEDEDDGSSSSKG